MGTINAGILYLMGHAKMVIPTFKCQVGEIKILIKYTLFKLSGTFKFIRFYWSYTTRVQ